MVKGRILYDSPSYWLNWSQTILCPNEKKGLVRIRLTIISLHRHKNYMHDTTDIELSLYVCFNCYPK